MKAFVTGSNGFLGTNLVQELARRGWDIIALHRPASDIRELKKIAGVQYALGDVTDISSLRAGIPTGVDAVFHVAGSVGVLPHHLEHTRYDVNVQGTSNVARVCSEKKAGRLIYTSTVLSLDFHACRPLNETAAGNDWSRDPYIHSKRLSDIEVEKAARSGLDVVTLRPSALFGAYDKVTWSQMFLEVNRGLPLKMAPPGGGSVCHARPVAVAHVEAFFKGKRGAHYILGGPDVTWFEVACEMARLLDKPAPKYALPIPLFKLYGWADFCGSRLLGRRPILTPHTIDILSEYVYSDSALARKVLDYKPSTLTEMLEDCHRWMTESGML